MMLPFASGQGDARIFLVPGEEIDEGNVAVWLHGAGQHVELQAPWTHQGAGTSAVDEKPLLQEVPSVIRQQRTLTNELHTALDLELWLSCGVAKTMELSSNGCGGEEEINM